MVRGLILIVVAGAALVAMMLYAVPMFEKSEEAAPYRFSSGRY